MLVGLIFVEGREIGGTKGTFPLSIMELQHKGNANDFSCCEKVQIKIKRPNMTIQRM